jgi:hypothetical protein
VDLGKYYSVNNLAKENPGYFELKQNKPRSEKELSKLLDYDKQAKFQWLQNPSQNNGNNLTNVGCETRRHLRNKKRVYLKGKINELETNRTKILQPVERHKLITRITNTELGK